MIKKYLILAALFCLSLLQSMAQEMTVIYEVRFNTSSTTAFANLGLSDEMRASLLNAYKDVVFTYTLNWKDGESQLRMIPSTKPQKINFMGQTMDLTASMNEAAKNYTYKNHEQKLILEKTSFLQKSYVVEGKTDSVTFIPDKSQTKEILGYECFLATSPDGKTKVWYTPHIPLPNEPIPTNLPGLALEVNNGEQIFTAVKIELDTVSEEPQRPESTETISGEDFKEMVEKYTEMMKRGSQTF